MALQTAALERAFKYNSVDLTDPGPQYTPEQVRDFYAAAYPEIVSAGIDGPEQANGKLVYTFRRAVGTKGGEEIAAHPMESPVIATIEEKEAAFEWLRAVALSGNRHALIMLDEIAKLKGTAI